MVARHETPYGRVRICDDHPGIPAHVAISATGNELYDWAHRVGSSWPCSELAQLEQIRVEFDANGLLDLITGPTTDDLSADELNAWSSDVLRDVLPESHPAWFVTVGQFDASLI